MPALFNCIYECLAFIIFDREHMLEGPKKSCVVFNSSKMSEIEQKKNSLASRVVSLTVYYFCFDLREVVGATRFHYQLSG